MNIANKISTFRILIVPFFVACFIYFGQNPFERDYLRFIALSLFLLGVISDGIDGFIARKSKQQSPAGLILDPLGDKLLLMSGFISLYAVPLRIKFPLTVVLIIISRDILILLGAVVIFIVKQKINIFPTLWGKLTTIFQMLAVICVILQWEFSFLFWWVAVLFTLISGCDYIMRGFKTLYALDTVRNNH
ncbi:MAG: CDP-alcohol phosphatidyltransferase family protein [Candidatus Omnitrophota bacterium]